MTPERWRRIKGAGAERFLAGSKTNHTKLSVVIACQDAMLHRDAVNRRAIQALEVVEDEPVVLVR